MTFIPSKPRTKKAPRKTVYCALEGCSKSKEIYLSDYIRRGNKKHYCCREHQKIDMTGKKLKDEHRKPQVKEDGPHAGYTTCLSCLGRGIYKEFWSPDVRSIRRCSECKQDRYYHSEGCREARLRM